jgi:hypothetical protein
MNPVENSKVFLTLEGCLNWDAEDIAKVLCKVGV